MDIIQYEEKRLSTIEAASQKLSEANTIQEVTEVRNYAEAIRLVSRQAKAGLDVQNQAAELKLRAERRAGEMLAAIERVPRGNRRNHLSSPDDYSQVIESNELDYKQAHNWQQIASIPEPDFEQHIEDTKTAKRELTSAGTVKVAKQRKNAVHFSSATPEWYTPQIIIDRVLSVFGEVDLDPCSNAGGIPNIPATNTHTHEGNGLVERWHGRVYMNPPYGDEIKHWIDKLVTSYEDGDILQGIALVPARTDTKWFQRMKNYPRCFIWGRLKFSGAENSAPFPSMVVYLGDDLTGFYEAFHDIGDIYQRIGK